MPFRFLPKGLFSPATPLRFWTTWGVCVAFGRASLLAWLYASPAPTGGSFVDNWTRFLPHALVAETGMVAALLGIALLADVMSRGRVRRPLAFVATVVAVLYLVAAHFDAELMRWMGQHLTFSWVANYLGLRMDATFIGGMLGDQAGVFLLGTGLTLSTCAALLFLARKAPRDGRVPAAALVPVLLVAAAGMTSSDWLAPSRMRWHRIQPVAWVLGGELAYRFRHASEPEGFADGVRWLVESGNPGAAPREGYPFWKEEPGEEGALRDFRGRPDSLRPDIVVFQIESLRGWATDLRDPETCARLPNLCGLARRGLFFPNARSVGFPSVEGFVGLHLGVWSHPDVILLNERTNLRTRALPEILGEAGYFRAALTATEPSFDNLTPWLDRWYDFWEFDPSRRADGPLADRFVALYRDWPRERPVFAVWFGTSTHIPFRLPPEHGPAPEDPGARYARVQAYTDSAVGMILREIARNPRGRPTVVVAIGDHAIPNNRLSQDAYESMAPGPGKTWTPLWIAGPGIPAGRVVARPVSQLDIAPTLLHLLGLRVSNHFVGRALAGNDGVADDACDAGNRVLAFGRGGMTSQRGACRHVLRFDDPGFTGGFRQELSPARWPRDAEDYAGDSLVGPGDAAELAAMRRAGEAWRWVLDRNLLRP